MEVGVAFEEMVQQTVTGDFESFQILVLCSQLQCKTYSGP
jgi:hypothetical protein